MTKLFISILMTISSIVYQKGDEGYDTYRIPAIIQAPSGDLLAFAEARLDGAGDAGQIDLVLRRSSDGGRSWSPIQKIWSEEGYTCGNPAPVVDAATGRILLLCTRNLGSDNEEAIRNGKSKDSRRVFILSSDDNGKTWSEAREITASTKRPDWSWYATGPCHAIQLQHERFKGRIVVPCDHCVIRDGKYVRGGSHVIISDDGGENWRIGGICADGNECTISETRDGNLLLNMRLEASASERWPGHSRLMATSINGGESFSPVWTPEGGLQEPVCQGSMTNYSNRGLNTDILLFSNPDNESKRINLTLKASADGGHNWKEVSTICPGNAAYSDLAVLADGSIGVMYETGEANAYERILYQSVDREIGSEAVNAWSADRFSMFIHFGVYSSLGGVWNGKPVTVGYSEQIQAHAGIYNDLYIEVAQKFNPERFDADSIAQLAKDAGMRSIIITSKHHDGFCLFDTKTTDFNSMACCGRDFIKELSEACGKAGIKFGLYYSLIDWHDPYGSRISSDNGDIVKPEHHKLNVRQVAELVSSYGPISELWFDMGRLTKEQSQELYRIVHLWQPDCMVSGRLGNDCYDFCVMGDNSLPDGTLKTAWQAPASMFNGTWGYRSWQKRDNLDGKVAQKLRSLLSCAGHGGNYILNIGPKGDGSIVPFEREVLNKMGDWLKINGEAIYSTSAFAWPGIDGWGYCTCSGNNIYLTPGELDTDCTTALPLGQAKLLKAVWLDTGEKCQTSVKGGVLEIPIKACDVSSMPRVIKLSFDRQVKEPSAKTLKISGHSAFVLDKDNAVSDHSYSCTYYYDNHQSIVGYCWTVSGRRINKISVKASASLSGRRINLSIDGLPVLDNATISDKDDVTVTRQFAAGQEHNIHLTAADMDNPHTDINLEDICLVLE